MNLKDFTALLSSTGQDALEAAMALRPREEDFLRHYQTLCQRFPCELARAALETAILRLEAAASAKFPQPQQLYFTRPALEQASNYRIALYRAERYRRFSPLVDLGCSIGGDMLAFIQIAPVVGIDLDPLRLRMAQANLQTVGSQCGYTLIQADLRHSLPFHAGQAPRSDDRRRNELCALFFDPARRSDVSGERRRFFSVNDYLPPLSVIDRWLPHYPALGVKLSPGVRLDELRTYDAEIEFISLEGELKEAVLWFGPLKSAQRRATLISGPAGEQRHTLSTAADDCPARALPLSQPLAYLYEPDPAIIRSGLVAELGNRLSAAQLDADIAYLTATSLHPTPFGRAWEVVDWFPFHLKRLRAYLRARRIGRVTVKKRGSPLQPQDLIRRLRLSGESATDQNETVIVLTHYDGNPIVIICRQPT